MTPDRYPPLIRDALTHIPGSVPRSLVAPPLHRMSWSAGVVLPPPLMAGFVRNFLYFGIVFGLLFGLVIALLGAVFSADFVRLEQATAPVMLLAGVGYGLLMAGLFAFHARRHRVPTWSNLQGMREVPPQA